MKIGIDARMLGPQCGGLGRYVQQLVLHLQLVDTQNEYVIFLKKDNWHRFEATSSRFKKVLADVPWYGVKEQIKMPGIIMREKVDLMHFPHFNVPLAYNRPFVVTIHDLLLLHYPSRKASTLNAITYFFKNKSFRLVLRHAARKSKCVIATSEFTRQDIAQSLKVDKDKIKVTYQAPFINKKRGFFKKNEVLKKYKIDKPYILYVGVAYPHKNLEGLWQAWKIFIKKYSNDYQLVLVGKKNYFYERFLKENLGDTCKRAPGKSTAANCGSVVYTNFVEDDELCLLYENAYLYVFPSLYEGFGLPPLEAMSYGVPVISSNRTCLPEVLSDAAVYFDPENYEQMAESMNMVLNDKQTRLVLQQNARQHLSKYTWEDLAEKTASIYNNC